jgi:hypothetical protein
VLTIYYSLFYFILLFALQLVDMLADSVGKEEIASLTPPVTATAPSGSPMSPAASSVSIAGAGGGGSRSLETLTVVEVGELMDRMGLGVLTEGFAAKSVTGMMLSGCEEVSDLKEPGFGVESTATARKLVKKIAEWNKSGVPSK